MACLSDIDLATLHKTRLEERVNYKLSYSISQHNNNHHHHNNNYYDNSSVIKKTLPNYNIHNNNYITSKVISNNRNFNNNYNNIINNNNNNNNENINNCDDILLNRNFDKLKIITNNNYNCNNINNEKNNYSDNDGYFSSTTRRRRSGTWPRTRSLNAPSPFQQFGPCGRIMKNPAMVMQIQDPASQRLTWYKPPLTVLVIKKVRDSTVLSPFVQLVEWLVQEKHMVVWVEAAVLDDPLLQENKKFIGIKDKLVTFKDGRDDLTDRIDFIVCLGGDGTLLYASLLFQQSVPPVMAFHLGSLGFLTPFQFDNFQQQVTNVLEGHAALTLRSRLRCIIVRKTDRYQDNQNNLNNSLTNLTTSCTPTTNKNKSPSPKLTNTDNIDRTEKNLHSVLTSVVGASQQSSTSKKAATATNILVLNEVVIDRGPSPFLSNIDLFLDGKHITSVQGDGLIVSTPTGSTAYAVAAGASMIHPSVPAIMVTPICPHSLSFRPIVVPAGVELRISISPDSRNTSWVSFDGRNRQELFHGDSLSVTTSIYPVPSICAQDQISDWFDSLAECLHWNVRKRQKCLDELCDLTGSSEETLDELEKGCETMIDC